jgi:hypothetical protein
MKEGKEIYVVWGSLGSYEDFHRWVVGVTFDEDIANQLKKEYDEMYFGEIELPYPREEFDDLVYKYTEEQDMWKEGGGIDFERINDPRFTKEIYDLFAFAADREYMEYGKARIEKEKIFY